MCRVGETSLSALVPKSRLRCWAPPTTMMNFMVKLLVVASMVVTASSQSNICGIALSLDYKIDLSPLTEQATSYLAYNGIDDHDYYLNVCDGLHGPQGTDLSMSANCSTDPTVGACQDKHDANGNTADGFPKILGSRDNMFFSLLDPSMPDDGVLMQMSGGTGNGPNSCHSNYTRSVSIEFRCDTEAGIGVPHFAGESEGCVYSFTWRTQYACKRPTSGPVGPAPFDCSTITDAGVVDLSQLAKADGDWQVAAEGYLFHLSICHQLNSDYFTGDCMNDRVGACQTSGGDNPIEKSLGIAGAPFVREDDIVITFENGTACSNGNARRADLVFHCKEDAGIGHPTYLGEAPAEGGHGSCHYLFQWDTEVACGPDAPTQGFNCTVHDPVENYDFSLMSLSTSTGYNVSVQHVESGTETTLNINVCAAAPLCHSPMSAACELPTDTNPTGPNNTGTVSDQLVYNHGDLTLTYNTSVPCGFGGAYTRQAIIEFLCNEDATPSVTTTGATDHFRARSVSADGCAYLLEYETSLACPPPDPKSCVVQDNETGALYDLSSLTKSDGYWAIFPEPFPEYTYAINLCAAVDVSGCSGNAACQLLRDASSTNSPYGYGLGRASSPRVEDDHLVIEYVGGTICHANNNSRHTRSTKILLYCQMSAGIGEPRFIEETDCSYTFEWYTSEACMVPIDQMSSGNCSIQDRDGSVYDFSSLTRNGSQPDYRASGRDGEFVYDFNICGPAHGCVSKTNDRLASACQLKPTDHNFKKVIGHHGGNVTIVDEKVRLINSAGPHNSCGHAEGDRSVVFSFTCPESAYDDNTAVYIDEDDSCTYFIEFRTQLACKAEAQQCLVSDPNTFKVYDFSELQRNSGSNFEATDPDTGAVYEINLCRSVLGRDDQYSMEACPRQAAACQRSAGRSPISIGQPSSPKWDVAAGHAYIEYEGGQGGCHAENYTRKTRIDFLCAGDDSTIGLRFERETPDCQYLFTFYTRIACNENDVITTPSPECTVTDPATNAIIDLSELAGTSYPTSAMNSGHPLRDSGGNSYALSICRRPDTFPCSGMACQTDSNGGMNNMGGYEAGTEGSLSIVDGIPMIRYINGDRCHAGRANESNRSTVIEFHCDHTAGLGYPQFISESDDCAYLFHWYTNRVCQISPFDCTTRKTNVDGEIDFYDLSELSLTRANWNVSDPFDPSQSYQINVCKGLTAAVGSQCDPTAGACQVTSSNSYSLGAPKPPMWDPTDGSLYIQYDGGSPCHSGQYNRSLRIFLKCPTDNSGYPIYGVLDTPIFLSETAECQYHFSWRTSAACPVSTSQTSSCSTVSADGTVFDLSPLNRLNHDELYEVRPPGTDHVYRINICGATGETGRECMNNGICQITDGGSGRKYGLGRQHSLRHIGNSLQMTFMNGSRCHDGLFERSATIEFRCNKSVTNPADAYVEFIYEYDNCSYEFEMQTALACESTPVECSYNDPENGDSYDLTELKSDDGWGVRAESDDEFMYYINVCRDLSAIDGHPACSTGAACQVSMQNGDDSMMGKASTTAFSVEDGKLVLRYSDGDTCHNGDTRQTIVEFQCAMDIGKPIYIGEVDHCVYKFVWISSFGCPEGQPGTPPPANAEILNNSHCTVVDTRDGATYSLAGLQSGEVLAEDGRVFRLSACGAEGHCGDGSVCQASGSTHFTSIGRFTSDIYPVDTVMMADYRGPSGSDCSGSHVTFMCNPTPPVNPVNYVGTDYNGCTQIFEWETDRVCQGPAPLECVVTMNDGRMVDLSPLRGRDYWRVDTTGSALWSSKHIEMNVCEQVKPSTASPSCRNAAICDLSQSQPSDVILGSLYSEPRPMPGGAELIYTTANPNCGTSIQFTCDETTLGTPRLINVEDGCFFTIQWATSVMCGPTATTPSPSTGCELLDPVSFEYYNLKGLMGRLWTAPGGYQIAVCEPINGTGSCSDAGVCRQGMSLGVSSSVLTRSTAGQLKLEYFSGNSCGNGVAKSTILFTCDSGVSDQAGPTHDDILSTDCEHYFVWPTPKACAGQVSVPCYISDSAGTYDLSRLVRTDVSTGNYIVTNDANVHGNLATDTHEYVLNVCHRLLRDASLPDGCGGGSFAGLCQLEVINNANGSVTTGQTKSAGTVATPVRENGELLIRMMNGDTCSNGQHRSTTIKFICDQSAGLGHPVFESEIRHCEYQIRWRTAEACVRSPPPPAHGCRIETQDNRVYNLAPLAGSVHVSDPKSGADFQLSLCDAQSTCSQSNADACVTYPSAGSMSLGRNSGITLSGKVVIQEFKDGDACSPPYQHQRRSAQILYECDRQATSTTPQLLSIVHDCHYTFVLRTALVCQTPATQCSVWFPSERRAVTLAALPRASIVTHNSRGTIEKFWISLCELRTDSPCSTSADAGVCATFGNNQGVSLGKLDGARPNPEGNSLITLVYSNGDECPGNSEGSGPASSSIKFECDKRAGFGRPEFLEGPTSRISCTFKFRWKTCLVCRGENPCSLAPTRPPTIRITPAPPTTQGVPVASSDSSTSGSGGAIATIFILAALVAGAAFFLKDSDRREWLKSMVPSFGSSTPHSYKSLHSKYENNGLSSGLLYDSDGDDDDDMDDEQMVGGLDSTEAPGVASSNIDEVESSGGGHSFTIDEDDEEMLAM